LEPALLGQRFSRVELRRKDLRFPFPARFAARLTGGRVEALERRAKYILVHLDTGESLVSHLGMTGRFTVLQADGRVSEPGAFYHDAGVFKESPHDHVLLVLENGTRIIYNDARRFGFMDVVETAKRDEHKMFRGMGVEPLGNSFNAEHLAEKFVGKSAPLKAALLDQRVVAGLGNIYVSEALFRAGLSPKRKAGTLVKRNGIDARIRAGGSTLQDFQHADGSEGSFQQRFKVYDLAGAPCPNGCGQVIKRLVQAGRSSFYCSHCQK
jgi:formamidopyrimidine-DNA glycosylase